MKLDKADQKDQEVHMTSRDPAAPARPDKASLKGLKPLVPFALRYKGRIAAALVALIMASTATLIIPLAVRRMIDFGFSAAGADLIDRYFLIMIAVVSMLAVASASRYYLVRPWVNAWWPISASQFSII